MIWKFQIGGSPGYLNKHRSSQWYLRNHAVNPSGYSSRAPAVYLLERYLTIRPGS
jgi:hypothetical protein